MSSLSFFVLAAFAFAVAAVIDHPASAGLLLAADALVVTGIARAIGFRSAWPFLQAIPRNAAPLLGFLVIYAAFVEIIVGYPMSRLAQDPSLDITLALSTTLVLVVLSLWKFWPVFGICVLIRRSADEKFSAMKNAFACARHITDQNELFFSHGLLVSLSLLTLAEGAFTISGFGFPLHGNQRVELLAIYAIFIAPMAGCVVINRTANALLLNAVRERSARVATYRDANVPEQQIDSPAEELPAQATAAELDAMLLRCVRAGQTQLALSTLARGANPNCVPDPADRDQRSVIELASVSPDMRLLRGLIAKGADLNRAHAGLPPLIAATRDSLEGRPDAVMTLLTNGADPRCVDRHGDTPMHCAALCEKPIMAALLGDAGAPLDAVNSDGLTPLGIACSSANWDMVRFLLERGAKLETEHGQPAILAAAGVNDDDIQGVKLLIKRKARVDALGPLKRTALMAAAMNGNELIAQMLLDAGADIDLTDAHGTTALMESARASAAEVLDVFASRNPALDVIDSRGRTALMIACQSVHASEAIVRRLLDMGATRDIALTDGRRAVDLAAAAGRWNIVALLDPNYPRPQNVDSVVATPSTDGSADHLLDALRFGHWHVVDRFGSSIRNWPSDVLAKLFVDLIRHDDAAPRRWLLVNGLSPDTQLENRSLLATALAELPDSLAAVSDLLDAGAPVGSDLLPHIFRAARMEEYCI